MQFFISRRSSLGFLCYAVVLTLSWTYCLHLQGPILVYMDATAVALAWESYRKYSQSELWEVLNTTSPILTPFLQLSCVSPHSSVYRIGHPENGGNIFLQTTRTLIYNTVQKPKRRPSTDIPDHCHNHHHHHHHLVVTLLRGCWKQRQLQSSVFTYGLAIPKQTDPCPQYYSTATPSTNWTSPSVMQYCHNTHHRVCRDCTFLHPSVSCCLCCPNMYVLFCCRAELEKKGVKLDS
jgi:hypothetical protein